MDKAISAQNQVCLGYGAFREIEDPELSRFVAVHPDVLRDHLGNDGDADVLRPTEVDLLHPVEVAARSVEKDPDIQFPQRCRQVSPDARGMFGVRSFPGSGFLASPRSLPIALREDGVDSLRFPLPQDEEIQGIADGFDPESIMTSAKTGAGVEEAFVRLGTLVAKGQLEGLLEHDE